MHVAVGQPQSSGSLRFVAVVCDGMGGMRFGKEAAAIATASFLTALLTDERVTPGSCLRAIRSADAAVHQRFLGKGGTTLSAVVTNAEGRSLAVHAGDSRIYEIDDEWNIRQVSHDDNLKSALSPNQAIDAELGSRLIQYVGMGDEIEPHVFAVNPTASKIMLTTDGAHSIDLTTFRRIVKNCSESQEVIRKLINVADYVGGIDNASIVISPVGSGVEKVDSTDSISDILHIVVADESFQIWGALGNGSEHPYSRQARNHRDSPVTPSPAAPPPVASSTTPGDTSPDLKENSAAPIKASNLRQPSEDARPSKPSPTQSAKRKKAQTKRRRSAQKPPELDLEAPPAVSVEFGKTDGEGEKE